MANQITRDIYVLRKSIIEPIHYVRLTNAVDIVFNMRDYDIPSGAVAAVYAQKPDGTAVYSNATISDNSVTVEMTTQMVAVLGVGHLQVRIQSGSNSADVLCSFVVPLIVEPNFTEGDFPPSKNENGFFGDVEEHLQQVESDMTTMKEEWTEFQSDITQQVQEIQEEQDTQGNEITDLQKKVAKLDEEKSPALVLDASGSWVTVEDSGDSAANGLTIHGKSTQVVTTGAQLLNVNTVVQGGVNTDTGDLFVNQAFVSTDYIPVEAGNYFVSGINISANLNIAVAFDENKTVLPDDYINIKANGGLMPIPENVKYVRVRFISDNGVSGTITPEQIAAKKPMLNRGTTALPWEPFTGGAPAPSPDYPQEITSVGDSGSVEVVSTGAQLIDFSKSSFNNCSLENANTGTLKANVTDSYYEGIRITYLNEYLLSKRGETITFSAIDGIPEKTMSIVIFGTRTNGTTHQEENCARGENLVSLTVAQDFETITGVELRLNRSPSAFTDTNTLVTGVMLNTGNTAIPFVPYVSSTATFSTPNGLPGIPVDSGGNYTDADGQQWICDEIDTKAGVYIRRVGKITFDGSSDEVWNEYNEQGIVYIVLSDAMPSQNVICNYFKSYEFYPSDNYKDGVTLNINKSLCFHIVNMSSVSGSATWRTWLSTHNVTVLYPLATPVETPLSDAELIEAGNLRTFATTTNITTEDPVEPEITLEYAADLKTYIDKKIAEISAATLENATTHLNN